MTTHLVTPTVARGVITTIAKSADAPEGVKGRERGGDGGNRAEGPVAPSVARGAIATRAENMDAPEESRPFAAGGAARSPRTRPASVPCF